MFLCTFHVTKTWLEQIRRKLVDKMRYKAAFDALREMLYFKAAGSGDERLAAVETLIAAFKQAFAQEPALLSWFCADWYKKRGAQP